MKSERKFLIFLSGEETPDAIAQNPPVSALSRHSTKPYTQSNMVHTYHGIYCGSWMFLPSCKYSCGRILLDRLPVFQRIWKHKQSGQPIRIFCRTQEETVEHLFASCPVTVTIWNSLPSSIEKPTNCCSLPSWFWQKANMQDRKAGTFLSWYIWKMRNNYSYNAPLQSIPGLS